MRFCIYLYFLFLFNFLYCFNLSAKETWVLDKNLSNINFEIPIFLAKNVQGKFKNIDGVVEIDLENQRNNKAIFSVNLESIEMNYIKYKPLLMSKVFFNTKNFPKAVVDTKKFSYVNEKTIDLNVELIIKGISADVPLQLEIIKLAKELVQIKGELSFSRTSFNIGTGKWSSTAILRDNALIKVNLFLYKN
tara:strand:+ start:62 stop:634 length:573 start_codon:yes stop_codon:yes gene_type:complete